ncbi:MAG: hypothetical protein SH809_10715 [Rhodothermales bacterium]|nr:hypothetical protein [Rhodothermales bacterium]
MEPVPDHPPDIQPTNPPDHAATSEDAATPAPLAGRNVLNSHIISLITLVIGVFFSGAYIRGESARKQEINREIDTIRQRQTEIVAAVAEINRIAAEKDSILLGRIAHARTFIEHLDRKEAYSEQEIQAFGQEIRQLQGGIDSVMAAVTSAGSFAVPPPAPVIAPVVESPGQ